MEVLVLLLHTLQAGFVGEIENMKCRVMKILFLTSLKVGLFVEGKLVLFYFTLKSNVQYFQSSDKRAIIYRAFTKVILKIVK